MNCSCLDFVSYAKKHGCKSVIDVFMHPRTEDIYFEEYKKWPEFGNSIKQDDSSLWLDLWQKAFGLADILLCPSEWVAEGICEIAPYAKSKILLVPYGNTIDYAGRVNNPIVGRIFFAGGNAVGKGLPYLAQAATRLRNEIPELDVRIAGQLPPDVVNHPLCKDLNFLGKLSSEQMKEEYLSADLFVLPSLTDSFAGVVAEAMGAGCPVVITKETGISSTIVHGREGLIVAVRDTGAIVEAIKAIVGDRNIRNEMSKACLEQISFYSEAAWQKRLIDAITS
jgi:glycosyltransferase involved in cell wall biosynthesis